MRTQGSRRKFLASGITVVALFLVTGMRFVSRAESQTSNNGMPAKTVETTQEKIARAMSAGPESISQSARIVDTDAQGNHLVLREGSNGFTCMPGNPEVVGDPPMCADAPSMHGLLTPKLTNQNRLILYQASRTCSRVPPSEAIRILMTPRVLLSLSVRTG